MNSLAIALIAFLAGWLGPIGGDWDSWAEWWRLHRREYFAPAPFESAVNAPATTAVDPKSHEWRAMALSAATGSLKSGEAPLRRSAAIALGRLAEPLAARQIAPLLEDGDPLLRRSALLALGTLGSEDARVQLLAVVAGPNRSANSALDVGTALVALTLCRLGPIDEKIDAALEARLEVSKKIPREVQAGALLHQKLARVARLWPATHAIAANEQVALDIRALAFEALAFSPAGEDYELLAAALRGREVELRRSAALALAVARDPRAVAALIAAVDDEKNAAARGFMILSLGKLASEEAVARLLVERQRTAALDRAWAWLALGLAARAGNGKARAALDLPLETKLQPGEHATSLLAIGLARQVGAQDFLELALASQGAADISPFAIEGLALMATHPAHAILAARFAEESVEADASTLGEGLARMRIDSDAPLLLEHWRRSAATERRAEAAQSLARHGSAAAIEVLLKSATDDGRSTAERAAALEAASLALSRRPLDRLQALATNSNFFVLEPWILEIARSGL